MSETRKNNFEEMDWDIANRINGTIGYWDTDQICRYANKAYLDWFGKTPEEMIGKMTIKELIGPLYEINLPLINKALNGEKQIFERQIILPTGVPRDSIISYLPDIVDGEVRGFFVHIVDATITKLQEAELLATTKAKDKEILRSVIETHEKEREAVAVALRDGISQTVAYSKMMLQAANLNDQDSGTLKKIESNIQQAIRELNALTVNLSLADITNFGLSSSLQDYIADFKRQFKQQVQFSLEGDDIEELILDDKISVFRIVQNFLLLLSGDEKKQKIEITVSRFSAQVSLILAHHNTAFLIRDSNLHYKNIQNRVKYYEGILNEKADKGKYVMVIQVIMSLTKEA